MSSNFNGVILVNLCLSGDFVELQTFSVKYGRSSRFLLFRNKLESIFSGEESYALDSDLTNFIRLRRTGSGISFHITWISKCWNSSAISGHEDIFILPDRSIAVTDGAMRKISQMGKQTRRALSKALRDYFSYGPDSTVHIYGDFGSDFYFENDGICGGLILHKGVLTGRDGREYTKNRYEVHT